MSASWEKQFTFVEEEYGYPMSLSVDIPERFRDNSIKVGMDRKENCRNCLNMQRVHGEKRNRSGIG